MLRKFGTAEVLSAAVGAIPGSRARGLSRVGHRYSFDYQPREGYLYVRSRAISSRCNLNYDDFPADEIRSAWRTFIGKPVFVNHDNEDVDKARGVIIDAALHEDLTPDGAEDVWVEVLMEVDAVSYPGLAKAILNGDIERTSMGVDCEWSQCSVCDNIAYTEFDFCDHVPNMKGMTYHRADGQMVLVREIVGGLTFFENSLLVEDPADPTAHFLAVDDRGVGAGSYRGSLTKAASLRRRANYPDPFQQAAEEIAMAGGTTVSTHGVPMPGSGYMIALPGREVVIPQDQVTVDTIRGYADAYRDDLADPERFLGGWVNEDNVYLDVSDHENVPERAFGLGREREQKAIWDIGNEMEWPMDPNEYMKAASRSASKGQRFYIAIDPDNYDAQGIVAFITSLGGNGMKRKAYGETVAPAQVDTLGRRDACPVCGEHSSAFDGVECMVCGYVETPDIFQEPDLSQAGELDDLREVEEVFEQDAVEDVDLETDGFSEGGEPETESAGQAVPEGEPEGDEAEEDEALFEPELPEGEGDGKPEDAEDDSDSDDDDDEDDEFLFD